MASADVWSDFESLRHNVKLNTVDRLKHILSLFNEQCQTNFTKTGKKQELIERITRELDLWKRTGNTEKWTRARNILQQVRSTGMYSSYTAQNAYAASSQGSYAGSIASSSIYQARPAGSTSNISHYDPYAPPRKATVSASASSSATTTTGIQFKHSPFFKVDRAVCNVIECPESTSQMDRKQQTLTFQMTSDILAKLNSASPKYQLRLYCTSSSYYSTGFRSTTGPCPIEFPPTCEVRVNSVQLNANLKGMKKKPGTAPPPDIAKNLRLTNGASNRVEMVYVNSQQPLPSKKYYMIVMLVEVTSVDQLIERLRKGKYRSSNEIIAKMAQSASEDDDIIAGSQKLSLKCPLSYMRITTPCRSSKCVHSQCFDAFSWYSMMEQTTTWLCPVCEKVLNAEELIVDGFFDEILKATHEDVEDVIVEADGQWHTSDNAYASEAWKAAHPAKQPQALSLPPTPPVKRRSPTPKPTVNGNGAHASGGYNNAEIVILDSDDEEEGQVKRELSPTLYRALNSSLASLPPRSMTGSSDIIDLTLDSDDEEPPRRAPQVARTQSQPQSSQSQSQSLQTQKKRKTDEREIVSPTEQIWKKSRVDAVTHSSPAAGPSTVPYVNGANGTNGQPYSSPRDPARTLPPLSPARYANAYARPPPPPTYNGSYIPPGSAPVPTRPPLPSIHTAVYAAPFVGRPNGSGASSSQSWRT